MVKKKHCCDVFIYVSTQNSANTLLPVFYTVFIACVESMISNFWGQIQQWALTVHLSYQPSTGIQTTITESSCILNIVFIQNSNLCLLIFCPMFPALSW